MSQIESHWALKSQERKKQVCSRKTESPRTDHTEVLMLVPGRCLWQPETERAKDFVHSRLSMSMMALVCPNSDIWSHAGCYRQTVFVLCMDNKATLTEVPLAGMDILPYVASGKRSQTLTHSSQV